jgi:hypothetical protein
VRMGEGVTPPMTVKLSWMGHPAPADSAAKGVVTRWDSLA